MEDFASHHKKDVTLALWLVALADPAASQLNHKQDL